MTKHKLKAAFHLGRIDADAEPFCGSLQAYDRLIRDPAKQQGDERELAEDEIDQQLNEDANGYV